ncbi:hypothetical protein CROQUDRAFT_56044 [Cronartium quercuum f. sp. fusiforme G11]|uniref:Late embryogenesis abundant protein LEA-2 subgroup domain-containing protein n=1 Tax=Cronartium quercuum f. sp. fusiforme G11 TaxID=708437 RepID=A0A9P6NRK7_9BASI|nr:hypothetical protein CROQUDRAFT_56044 [Cronartium quercuum f. sp. fusiforme G11]
MAYRLQHDHSPYPPASPQRQNGTYYPGHDPYDEPTQLPYGQAQHPAAYGQPDQDLYSPSAAYAPHHAQDYATSHTPYRPGHDAHYPPDADPYYSHPQAQEPSYYPEYEGGGGPGQMPYGLDEKHGIGEYPPPVLGGETPRNSGYGSPTRGSVAAQMAAEGAIPEKAGLRMWRSDEHSGAFMRGGKGKCCGRCCCCTLIVVALLLVGIVAGFLLWVRPPNATFNGIEAPTVGNQVDLQTGGFLLNFNLNIGVTNPNFFGASFSKISAKAFYPLNKTAPLGGGDMENVEIKPHSNTTIRFPFQINYTTTFDPKHAILADIAYKCGFLGATKNKSSLFLMLLSILLILAIAIAPTFSSSQTFTCPLKQSDFNAVLGGQQSMAALQEMLTGSASDPNARLRLRRREFYDWIGSLDLNELEAEFNSNMRLSSIGLGIGSSDWVFLQPLRNQVPSGSGSGWTGLKDKLVLMIRR